MRPRCPQCGGQPSYEEGGNYVCMMGGHRWPVNGTKPIIVYKRMEEDMEGKKSPCGKVGTCVNCGRKVWIADKEGLCGVCHSSVKGIEKGSTSYTLALASAMKRLTDPNTKRRTRSKAAAPVKRAKKSAAAAAEAMTIAPILNGPVTSDVIIETLTDWMAYHQKQVDKFKQAITLLS